MAFTLSTIYKAVDKFSGPMAAMEKANAKFAAAQTKSFAGVKTAFANIRNQIIGLTGNIGAAALIMTGFNAVKDFDESLASLKAITGLTGKSFIPFKQEIMAVGDELKVAYPTISKAMELMGSLDATLLENAKDMGMMTRAAVLLSKASGAELPESAQSLTSILKIFGKTAKDASQFVDILSTSEQKGTFTVSQLADGLKTVGGTARVLGMNVDQTAALLQALAPSTKSVEVASTGLNSILNKLGTTTKKQFNPAIVGSAQAIQNLKDANLDLKGAQALVGAERAGMLLSLINQNKVVQELSDNQYIQNNATKQLEERQKSFTSQVERLTAKFKNLFISGNETSGSLNMLGNVLAFVTNNLGTILTIVGLSIAAYTSYYAIMTAIRIATIAWNVVLGINYALQGAYPIALASSTVALTAFNVASKISAFATGLFSAALWACPITWIIAGILALGAGIFLLVKHWDKVSVAMGNFFTGAWDGIKKFARMILDFMLMPVVAVLKAISKLTGAKWAGDALAGIEKFKDMISDDQKTKLVKSESNVEKLTYLDNKTQANKPVKSASDILTGLDKFKNVIGDNEKTKLIKIENNESTTNIDNKKEPAKPVNTIKAANDVQMQRSEEIQKNQLELILKNKSNQQVNVSKNTGMVPLTTSTY